MVQLRYRYINQIPSLTHHIYGRMMFTSCDCRPLLPCFLGTFAVRYRFRARLYLLWKDQGHLNRRHDGASMHAQSTQNFGFITFCITMYVNTHPKEPPRRYLRPTTWQCGRHRYNNAMQTSNMTLSSAKRITILMLV